MAYIIKRYSNRKLYDPQSSRYVTLDDLKRLIQGGTDLRVDDATSGEDLTSLTLAQILLEGERTHQAALPAMLLHQLIRNGEAWYDFVQRLLRTGSLDQFPPGKAEAEQFWNQWAAFGGWPPSVRQRPAVPDPVVPQPAGAAPAGTPSAAIESTIEALKEKLSALEQRVSRRKKRRAARKRPARSSTPRRR